MKIKLVFPPAWDIKSPYPSIPCLDAYLKKQGLDSEQFDLNLEVFDRILSSGYLSACAKEAQLKGMEKRVQELLVYMAENIDECKETLRSEAALDPAVYKICWTSVNSCLSVVDDVWEGEKLLLGKYKLSGYEEYSSADVMRAVKNIMTGKVHSRLADLMREFVEPIVKDSDIIGLSVSHGGQIIPAMVLCAMCKKAKPNVKIVMGGSLVTRWSLTPEVLEGFFEFVDFFSFFEGEKSLASLIRYMKSEIGIEQVPSLGYMQGGKLIVNPAAESISMDELPTPVYDKKNLHRYFSPAPVLTLFTCRGCYWNRCAFCDHAVVYRDCYRTRSTDLIIKDIETIAEEYGTKYIAFNDEAITASSLRKLSREIISRNIDIRWRNDARFDKAMDKETLELAYKAGLRILFFGLESFNERVINLINKGIKLEWVEPIVKASSQAGIWNHIYVISGFPTETYEEYKDTCEFISRNAEYIDSVYMTPFVCSRFSDVARNPQKYNLTIKETPGVDLNDSSQAVMNDSDENITYNKRAELAKGIGGRGNEFLGLYGNTAAVIFSDYLIDYSRRKRNGEETYLSFVTPLYSKTGATAFAVVATDGGKARCVKVSASVAPFVDIINKYTFKGDILKSVSEKFGYPVEVAEILLDQVMKTLAG